MNKITRVQVWEPTDHDDGSWVVIWADGSRTMGTEHPIGTHGQALLARARREGIRLEGYRTTSWARILGEDEP